MADFKILPTVNGVAVSLSTHTHSYQPLDSELTALAGLTSAADSLPYFTGSNTAALTTLTTFGRSIINTASAAALITLTGILGLNNVWTGNNTFGNGLAGAGIIIDGAAGQTRDIFFDTGGVLRWFQRVTATAESGSNAGSDFTIGSRTDAGGALRTDLTITRSTGAWTFGGTLLSPTISNPIITNDLNLSGGGGNSYARFVTLDVADITSTQALTVDVTYNAITGNFTMLHCEISITGQRQTSSGANGYLHGWANFNTAAGVASIKGYELNYDTTGTPACSITTITDGIRFTFDSSGFTNTLNNNTISLLITGAHADAATVTVAIA